MPPTMMTQSDGWPTAASRGGGTGRRAGRGGGRTRGRSGNQVDSRNDGLGGQIGGQGSEVNGGVDAVHDFSTIIAQELQNVIHFKKGIAKYAKVSSTPLKCLDLDSSYFIQEIILL
ncbi:hypothetical protein Tco_1534117 [Tanacetum coccineum]